MVMTADAFTAAFPGESEHVELKQGVGPSRIQETAVAFSNTDGGVMLLGVSPSHEIVGVTNAGEKIKDVYQALRDTRNPGRYEVDQLQVGDKTVLVVAVARRHEGFAQAPNGAVLVRQGASNVALLGDGLTRFIARRSFQHFETTPTKAPYEQADVTLVAGLAEAFGWPVDDTLPSRLEEEGFVTLERGEHVVTVAGSLLLLAEPSAVGGRPYIDVRRFEADASDPDKTWLLKGSAPSQIEETTRVVLG